ncbi:hypothetical protein PTTG_27101 [Puccinia triticina 1-1 BBBD Race 1]|uniref:Uncharacterized protein n=1 Tax=Puccinia triticina (isolate 1-1 / race 1 (BBBD)) TaxID=630390 RepID=A0A180GN45_PUCT1|nr:hypothetical protein PTTG_27101 [Puccinia triticina 1-1 BBBD Race 1]
MVLARPGLWPEERESHRLYIDHVDPGRLSDMMAELQDILEGGRNDHKRPLENGNTQPSFIANGQIGAEASSVQQTGKRQKKNTQDSSEDWVPNVTSGDVFQSDLNGMFQKPSSAQG